MVTMEVHRHCALLVVLLRSNYDSYNLHFVIGAREKLRLKKESVAQPTELHGPHTVDGVARTLAQVACTKQHSDSLQVQEGKCELNSKTLYKRKGFVAN